MSSMEAEVAETPVEGKKESTAGRKKRSAAKKKIADIDIDFDLDDSPGSRIPWTEKEDEILREAVVLHKGKNWKLVAECLEGRSRAQCAHRWQKVLNPEIKKGAWSAEEDELLKDAIALYGVGKWSRIADAVPGRNGKQCRERYHNHLMPDVKKSPWTAEEDSLIIEMRGKIGNKWAQIARELPGRTENAVKNRWNAKLCLKFGGRRGSSSSLPFTSSRGKVKKPSARKRANSTSDVATHLKEIPTSVALLKRFKSADSLAEDDSTSASCPTTPISRKRFSSADLRSFSSLSFLVDSAERLLREEIEQSEDRKSVPSISSAADAASQPVVPVDSSQEKDSEDKPGSIDMKKRLQGSYNEGVFNKSTVVQSTSPSGSSSLYSTDATKQDYDPSDSEGQLDWFASLAVQQQLQ